MAAVVMATVKQFPPGFLEIMSATSKTGLLPSVRKNVKTEVQERATLELPRMVVPAPFTLRPFAGVYNPFPYGCSILCNHPADFEAKAIVKKAKDAWATEGKSLIDLDEASTYPCQGKTNREKIAEDEVPEELFRKYTDTDSRPITPAPTLISTTTKASQNLRARRCMTPDPTSFIPTKEKTLLVLDLRRSHSQEMVCWPGDHAAETYTDGAVIPEASTSRTTSPSSASQPKKKKTQRKKTAAPSEAPSSLKTQTSRDSDSKIQTQHSSETQSPSKASVTQEHETSSNKIPAPPSPQSSSGDANITRRRGKKRKGKKTGKEGLKEVQGIPDPGETQVSALENDSKEGSLTPSVNGDDQSRDNRSEVHSANPEPKPEYDEESKSFLNADILKQLQRQLDQEVVDSELNIKRKIALEEALRHKANPKHVPQGEEMKILKKEFQISIKGSEKWLTIPRVFTRRSARFELPLDSRLLNCMTPLEYVQKYVYASPERLVLYNHVFNLHKEDPEDDDEGDRIILGKNVVGALGQVMGRPMTQEETKDFQKLLDWKDDAALDFRTFTGISAACERVMGPRFCSSMPTQEEDPRYEVERADFETLEGKLQRLSPDRRLVKILRSIRDL